MKKCVLFFLFVFWAMSAFAGVTVYSPTSGSTDSSPVHFVASGSSPDGSKGIGGMGIYTAPYQLASKVSGSKIDTYVSLSNGTYNTVVQQWDGCGWSATKQVTITVGTGVPRGTSAFANLQTDSHWNGYTLMPPSFNICGSCTPSGPAITSAGAPYFSIRTLPAIFNNDFRQGSCSRLARGNSFPKGGNSYRPPKIGVPVFSYT